MKRLNGSGNTSRPIAHCLSGALTVLVIAGWGVIGRTATLQLGDISVTPLLEADGTPDNKALVTLPFDVPLSLLDASKISLSGYAIDPVSSTLKALDIPILSVALDPLNFRQLSLTTGVLVPQGASLYLGAGALAENNQPLPALAALLPQGISTEAFTLANRPFVPTDLNLFTPDAFPSLDFGPLAPVVPVDEVALQQQLGTFLDKRVNLGLITATQKADALNLYAADSTKAIIPDATLRAALLSLTGTVGDGAINAVLTSNNRSGRPLSSVSFDSTIVTGGVASANADGTVRIRINSGLQGEAFEELGSLLAHEALHEAPFIVDGVLNNGLQQEVINVSVQTVVTAQLRLLEPSSADQNTPWTRSSNDLLLALLNSGNRAFPSIGLTSAPSVQTSATLVPSSVFVGGVPAQSLIDYAGRTYAFLGLPPKDTLGNAYLDSALSAITQSTVTGADFTTATYQYVDGNLRVFSDAQIIELAKILKLTLPDRPAQTIASLPDPIPSEGGTSGNAQGVPEPSTVSGVALVLIGLLLRGRSVMMQKKKTVC